MAYIFYTHTHTKHDQNFLTNNLTGGNQWLLIIKVGNQEKRVQWPSKIGVELRPFSCDKTRTKTLPYTT